MGWDCVQAVKIAKVTHYLIHRHLFDIREEIISLMRKSLALKIQSFLLSTLLFSYHHAYAKDFLDYFLTSAFHLRLVLALLSSSSYTLNVYFETKF